MKSLLLAAVVTCTGAALVGCQSTSVIKSQGSSFQMQIPKTGIGSGADEEKIANIMFVQGKQKNLDVTKEGDSSVSQRVIAEEYPSLSSKNELEFRKGWYRETPQGIRLDSLDSYVEYKFELACGENKESYSCDATTKDDAKVVTAASTKPGQVKRLTEGDLINVLVGSYNYKYVAKTTSTPNAIAGKVREKGHNAQVSQQKNTVIFHVVSESGTAEVALVVQKARPDNRVEVQVEMTLNRSGADYYDYTPLASKVESFVREVTS